MSNLQKTTLWLSIFILFIVYMASAQAAMVGTTEIVADTQRTELLNRLERKEVQQQLIEMGVDPESAIKRVSNMTNEEIADINGQLDSLPAGAGLSNVELLLIIIIIILIV